MLVYIFTYIKVKRWKDLYFTIFIMDKIDSSKRVFRDDTGHFKVVMENLMILNVYPTNYLITEYIKAEVDK